MSTNTPTNGSHDDRVNDAIAWYYQEVEKGTPPTRQAFLDRYPTIQPELESFLADKAAFEGVASPANADSTVGIIAPASPALGTVRYFGDYELIEEIARGGMGVVYKARQVSLNRVVALKMILAGHLASPADVQRFRQEAESAASLDHPNILPIYEVGEHNGQQYFSMKLIEGTSLSQLGVVDQRWAAELMATLARAVHYAHQRGILHRDLKPANILLSQEKLDSGTRLNLVPYITDFGLAKRVVGDAGLTQTGALVGTPSYMSPEQARAEKQLSTGIDIYSLGAILYELLTGRPPFRGQSVMDTVLQVLEKEPDDPRKLQPKVNRDLAVIALKCLAKEPAKRYESAAALADDLDRWQRGEPIVARPVGSYERLVKWVHRHPVPAGFTALTLLLLVAGTISITAMYFRSERFRHDAESQRDQARDRLARQYAEKASALADAGNPLGGLPWLVEAATVNEGRPQGELHRIHLASILRTAPGLVHYSPTGTCVALHPDGRRVAIGEKNGVRMFRLGEDESLTPLMSLNGEPGQVLFTPDGRRAAVSGGIGRTGLGPWQPTFSRVFDVESGQPLTPEVLIGREKDGATQVLLSGDGTLLVAVWQGHVNRHVVYTEIYLYDLATLTPVGKPFIWGHPEGFDYVKIDYTNLRALTPCRNVKGDEVDFAARTQMWDLKSGRALFEPIPAATAETTGPLSPDGKHFLMGIESNELRVHDAATGRPVGPILSHEKPVTSADFHPTSHQIVSLEDRRYVRIWDWQEGKLTSQVGTPVFFGEDWYQIEFSPDGNVVLALGGAGLRAWDVASRSSLFHVEITRSGGVYDISPDGVLFPIADYEGVRLRRRDGTLAMPFLPHGAGVSAKFGPDGRFLATQGNGIRVWDTTTVRPSATKFLPERVAASVSSILSANGERVVELDAENSVQVFDSRTNDPLTPLHRLPGDWHEAGLTPDGRSILTIGFAAGRSNQPTPEEVRGRMDATYGGYVWQMPRDIGIWDAQTGQARVPPLAHRTVSSMQIHPNNRELYVVAHYTDTRRSAENVERRDEYSEIHRWDLATGELAMPVLRQTGNQTLVGISGDGSRLLALVSHGKTKTGTDAVFAQLWDSNTLEPASVRFGSPDSRIVYAVFSPDSERVLTVSESGEADVWDVSTGGRVAGPLSHVTTRIGVKPGLGMADFSPDGRKIVTAAGTDARSIGEARIWDASTGKPLNPTLTLSTTLHSATFSPDGRLLATLEIGDHAWHLRLWDVETGMPVSTRMNVAMETHGLPNGQFGRLTSRPRFTPDGKRIFLPAKHGMVYFDVLADARPIDQLKPLAQVLSGHEVDEAGSYLPLSEERASQARERWKQAFPPVRADRSATADVQNRQRLARQSMADKNWHSAIRWLTECLTDLPTAAWPWSQRAFAYEQLGQFDKARSDLDEAIRREDAIGLRRRRGEAFALLGQFPQACIDFAWVLERSGRIEDAIPLVTAQWAAGDREGHLRTSEILRDRRAELGKSWEDLSWAVIAIGVRPESGELLKPFVPLLEDARSVVEFNSELIRAAAIAYLRVGTPEKYGPLLEKYRNDVQGFYWRHRLPELVALSKQPKPPDDLAASVKQFDEWYVGESRRLNWQERVVVPAMRSEVKSVKK